MKPQELKKKMFIQSWSILTNQNSVDVSFPLVYQQVHFPFSCRVVIGSLCCLGDL